MLVVNANRIIERGTHERLLAEKGFYYDLYMSQFMKARLAGDFGRGDLGADLAARAL